MILIHGNYKALDREFDRLEKLPSAKTTMALDVILQAGFKITQTDVDIQTTSLKWSGKTKLSTDIDKWTGEISYGGLSIGVNNPVTYAIYEKARGGGHDFFLHLPSLHDRYVKAILKGLSK